MDPDLLAFQAAKRVADRFTDAVQRSTRAVADVRVARSAEFHGVWGVELHALKHDDHVPCIISYPLVSKEARK